MKRITITRNGNNVQFETVSIDNTENVFFLNQDPKDFHWPAFSGNVPFTSNMLGPAPSAPSSQCIVPTPPSGKNQVTYGCMMNGHGNERGVINVFSPLAAKVTKLPQANVNKQITTPQQLVKGGMSPYSISGQRFRITDSQGNLIDSGEGSIGPNLQLDPRMDNTGVWLTGTPTKVGIYNFTFEVNDAMGGNLQQVVYTMTVV